MKPTRFWKLVGLVLVSALILAGCRTTEPVDVQIDLPIDFLFKDAQGTSKANLLGTDIAYLGSAAAGSVYAGAREENASLVVIRFMGSDNFYSLKGLKIGELDQVICRVECDMTVALVEGADILIEIRNIDITKVLAAPRVVWQRPAAQVQPTQGATVTPVPGQAAPTQAAPAAGAYECSYLLFKKGTQALTLVPLKMRSSPVLPENFNSNVISYMQAGEKVEVLADSAGEWVNIKKAGGESGYSKQCTTLNGRFLQPGD